MDRRSLLTTALAGGALALAGRAFAAGAPLEASAARSSRQTVRLEWKAGGAPVSVFQSPDPDLPAARLRPLKVAAGDGAMDVEAPALPRPYFLLKAQDGRQTRVAERLLPLDGGRNFRDLGGYRAEDGRQVRWGRIYRSGVMTGLTAGDIDYLARLGVAVVCDLRSPEERRAEPSPFLKAGGPQVVTFDYDLNIDLAAMAKVKTPEDAIAAFAATYVAFVDTLSPHYTDMFARLLRGQAPLAMNCTAGKDRTGMGSALVLSVLGVPRDTVLADYALTQVYTPPAAYMQQMRSSGTVPGLTGEQAKALSRLPPEVLMVLMGSDPDVMRQALAAIDRKFGGPIQLSKARFGLDDAKIAQLRSAYLT